MAIKRPINCTHAHLLTEMSDVELEQLSYNFRVKWAALMKAGHDSKAVYDNSVHNSDGSNPAVRGNIFIMKNTTGGSDFSNPNTDYFTLDTTVFEDTRTGIARTGEADDTDSPSGGGDSDAPADPTTVLPVETIEYTKMLWAGFATSLNPGLGGHAVHNNYGYFIWNSGGYFQIDSDQSNIVDTILKHANGEMLSGDEVGTYRVSTSAPSSGGAGTWAQIGSGVSESWYRDRIASYTGSGTDLGTVSEADNNVYYLWLKENLTTFAGITNTRQTHPLGWDSSLNAFRQRDIGANDNLIFQILLPVYRQNPFFSGGNFPGYPRYFQATSSTVTGYQALRGTFYDQRYTGNTLRTTYGPNNGTYYKDRYGSGSLATATTYYFIMSMGDSTSYFRT